MSDHEPDDLYEDLDKALFWGASYNDELLLDRFRNDPPKPRYPFAEVLTSRHIKFPEPLQRFPLENIQTELPQWNQPNYRTKPLDITFSAVIPFYKTATLIGVYHVPKNKMVSIEGVSYEFDDQLNLFEEFDVEIYETGRLITRFTDMRVKTAAAEPNPAKQFAFSGHIFPLPIKYSVDKSYTITARVIIKGISPFPNTPVTPYNGSCRVSLLAYESSLADRRDGAPRLKAINKTLDEKQAVSDGMRALAELKSMYPNYDPEKVGT